MGEIFLSQLLALAIKLVGKTLDEKHPEDEFPELRSVHLAAQDVGGLEKEAFKLGKRDFLACHVTALVDGF
jgi:hypothetical protein